MASSGTLDMLKQLAGERLRPWAQFDFWLGAAAGGLFAWASWTHPEAVLRPTSAALGLVGVVLGSVIAGVAIQTAFMDQEFLRKLKAINSAPIRYLAPFIYSALLGIGAMVGLLGLSVVTASWAQWLISLMSGAAWFLTVWCVASLLPCLAMITQLADLKSIAAKKRDPDTIP